jgi:hypothetical protein
MKLKMLLIMIIQSDFTFLMERALIKNIKKIQVNPKS